MMLDVAETLDPLLSARAKRIEEGELDLDEDEDAAETTLQLIFFDGEEAFVSWTDTDSIYGAKLVHLSLYPSRHIPSLSLNRHLAEKWGTTYLPPHPKRRLISAATPTTPLSTIEHLVLVDLLGAAHPRVRSYYPDTAWLFDALVRAETRLRDAGILDPAVLGVRSFFHPRGAGDVSLGYMGDDHLPFLHRGVSVLHIIAEPFPRVWHTLGVSIYLLFTCYICHIRKRNPPLAYFLLRVFLRPSLTWFTMLYTGRRDSARSPDDARMEPHPSRVLRRVSRAASRPFTARRTVLSDIPLCASEEIGLRVGAYFPFLFCFPSRNFSLTCFLMWTLQ